MASKYKTWDGYTDDQAREINTAAVLVELGGLIHSSLSDLVAKVKTILNGEIQKLSAKSELSSTEKTYLTYLKETVGIDASVSGARRLEELWKKSSGDGANAEMVRMLKPIIERILAVLPSFLKFPGFGEILKQNAFSKFIEFGVSWKYTGKGYEPPPGMKEPFSGYDDIIIALMAHPLCQARMAREIKAWKKATFS